MSLPAQSLSDHTTLFYFLLATLSLGQVYLSVVHVSSPEYDPLESRHFASLVRPFQNSCRNIVCELTGL